MKYLILLLALCVFVGLITLLCGSLAALPILSIVFIVAPFLFILIFKLLNK